MPPYKPLIKSYDLSPYGYWRVKVSVAPGVDITIILQDNVYNPALAIESANSILPLFVGSDTP